MKNKSLTEIYRQPIILSSTPAIILYCFGWIEILFRIFRKTNKILYSDLRECYYDFSVKLEQFLFAKITIRTIKLELLYHVCFRFF